MENAPQGVICCCGMSSWTKFIGCFQLAANAIGMILVAMFLLSMTWDSSATAENIYGSSPEITLVIAFGVLVLGFIMGIVLPIGTVNVVAVLAIVMYIFVLLGAGYITGNADNLDLKKPDGTAWTQEEKKTFGAMGIAASILMIVICIVDLIMAIVLLKGNYNRNPRLLNAWVIYAIVSCILNIIERVVEVFGGASLVETFIVLVISLPIQGFFIYVVSTHKKEILTSDGAGMVYSAKA